MLMCGEIRKIHDERYECEICSNCCADEPMLFERNDTYEDLDLLAWHDL
jgi:hypothetical protein